MKMENCYQISSKLPNVENQDYKNPSETLCMG